MARDAALAMTGVYPSPQVHGGEHIPPHGPGLIVCNHYTRPGLEAWWLVWAISDAVARRRAPEADAEIHWVMTAAWTFPTSPWRHRFLTPLTRWAFRRVARVYGFVPMPPMPPAPEEVVARAVAVRQTLRLARWAAHHGGLLGLAPEGRDVPGGLGQPPEGAGDFIARLTAMGLPILPVGVAESGGRLCLSFGPMFTPDVPAARAERDRAVCEQVMESIARQFTAAQNRQ